MTYKEFCEKIASIAKLKFPTPLKNPKEWRKYQYVNQLDLWKNEPAIIEVWVTGGVTDGWYGFNSETDKMSSRDADPEPEFTLLDNLLEYTCPNISFLKYKNLVQNLEKRDSFTDYEYYGNSTDYGVKYITVQSLYDYLIDKEII